MISRTHAGELPLVSVVVPVLNGERFLKACLDSVFLCAYPRKNFEVILVDNGSTDRTLEIAGGYDVRTLEIPDVSIGAVRNYGVRHASGEVLAFLDADCIVSRNWLSRAVECLAEGGAGVGMVGALVRAPEQCNWVGKAWDLCYEKRQQQGEIDRLGAANMILRKEIFEKVGGFDERLVTGEDDDLCFRVRETGRTICSDPSITVYHLGEEKSLYEFFAKEVWRGQETLRQFLASKGRMSRKITAYGMAFLLLMTGFTICSLAWMVLGRGAWGVIACGLGMLLPPCLLALRAAWRSGKWRCLFQFVLLYLALGIARGVASTKLVRA